MKVQTYEEVFGHPLTVRDLVNGFDEDTKTGRVRAFGGNLNVRPPYQREFVYELDKQQADVSLISLLGLQRNMKIQSSFCLTKRKALGLKAMEAKSIQDVNFFGLGAQTM